MPDVHLRKLGIRLALISLITALAACEPPRAGTSPDAGLSDDAGSGSDAGATDGGTSDAGTPDSGTHSSDAGQSDAGDPDGGDVDGGEADAGELDGGEPDGGDEDGGVPDAGLTPSEQLQLARDSQDGAVNIAIEGALVTYVKPAVGSDPAGFFLQAEVTGPALFVAVDPATLSPAPAVGDALDLTVTNMATVAGMRRATTISGYARVSAGNAVTGLIQDVSAAADLVSALGDYEGELIHVAGTVASAFTGSGTDHVAATFDTSAISGDTSLKLRVPSSVRDALDLTQGCAVTIDGTPMWRFNSTAEPSAWNASEVTVSSCPAPKVVKARANSATEVVITFDRQLAPASVASDGSQFGFTPSLTAISAVVSGNQVTVATTPQTAGTWYTVTVATSITDTRGTALDAAAQTTTFLAWEPSALLLLNEVNPNISGSKDLLELLVVTGGSTDGIRIEQEYANPTVLATLPPINVASGDLIVVHFNAGAGYVSESTAKDQITGGGNYDTAWDVAGGSSGLTYSNRVLTVRSPDGTVQDAVPFVKTDLTNKPSGFPADLQALQAAGHWLPPNCGGAECTYTSTPTAESVSVSWTSAGSSATGNSVQRKPSANTKSNADWNAPAAQSFGAPNP